MLEETIFQHHWPQGEFCDRWVNAEGQILWQRPWQHNLIVTGLRRLLAALIKGDPQGEHLMFWAVGTGENTWDNGTLPAEASRHSLEQLYTETARKAIPADQITFLGGAFTNQLEIRLDFTTSDIPPGPGNQNWRLREFGLFAGGTAAPNTGILINHRIHPRIDMQDGFTLQRTLRLTF
jgi:hypothetical protein